MSAPTPVQPGPEPAGPEPASLAAAAGAERHRRNLLRQLRLSVATFYVSLAVLGVHSAVRGRGDPPAWELCFGLAWGLLVTWACVLDSRLRGKPLPWMAHWLFFGFWYVAFPIYYLRSRGWRGLPWLALWALIALLAVGLPGVVAMIVKILRFGPPV